MICVKLIKLNEIWGQPRNSLPSSLDQTLGPVVTDSRKFIKGGFFVPLTGESFDGHAFLSESLDLGAQGTVVEKNKAYKVPKGLLHWVVDDTLIAYQELASLHRSELGIPVIAVTGSVGKTTTREFIRKVLHPLGYVLATTGNKNNDVGVPLTLFEANSTHAALVLEMGMRGLGEIQRLSLCACPDIAVITNVGNAHIGRLGSRANIAKAKCEITAGLNADGLVIIPAGDPLLEETLHKIWRGRILRVALEYEVSLGQLSQKKLNHQSTPNPDIVGSLDLSRGLLNVEDYSFRLPLEGRHNALNFMLAIAVAKEFKIPFPSLAEIDVDLPFGRSERLDVGGITILDETYNASPEGVLAALDLLASQQGRRYAVLGKMYELGSFSLAFHRLVAERIKELELDGLILIVDGPEAEVMMSLAGSIKKFFIFRNPKEALLPLKKWLKKGDFLLLKGSRKVGLEKIIPALKTFRA